ARARDSRSGSRRPDTRARPAGRVRPVAGQIDDRHQRADMKTRAADTVTLVAAAVASALARPAIAQEGDSDPFTPSLPAMEEVVAVGRLRSSATDVVQERLDQQVPADLLGSAQ